MSNLVERWKKQLACYRAGFRSSINEQIIIETIEALKPVEDADVRAHIINIAGAYPKAADALERLARENAEYEEGNDADAEVIQLLQAKIEELQEKIDDLINARNLAWDKGYSQGRDDAHQTITGLQAKVEELEDMLQSAIERECCNERHIEQLETKLKASLQECDYCGTALKQEGTGIQDMMAEVEALSQEGK